LNKQDIDEIVKTGRLGWWEERKLRKDEPVKSDNPLDQTDDNPLVKADETR
jgi:hypothetical protein